MAGKGGMREEGFGLGGRRRWGRREEMLEGGEQVTGDWRGLGMHEVVGQKQAGSEESIQVPCHFCLPPPSSPSRHTAPRPRPSLAQLTLLPSLPGCTAYVPLLTNATGPSSPFCVLAPLAAWLHSPRTPAH